MLKSMSLALASLFVVFLGLASAKKPTNTFPEPSNTCFPVTRGRAEGMNIGYKCKDRSVLTLEYHEGHVEGVVGLSVWYTIYCGGVAPVAEVHIPGTVNCLEYGGSRLTVWYTPSAATPSVWYDTSSPIKGTEETCSKGYVYSKKNKACYKCKTAFQWDAAQEACVPEY
jgi:hypothetical protein